MSRYVQSSKLYATIITIPAMPEEIVFQDPDAGSALNKSFKTTKEARKEREKFLRGNISDVFSSTNSGRNKERSDDSSPSNDLDLKATLREVQSLALSSLAGKERRKFETEQLKSLGAKASKSECVPYPHYQRVTSARREKEKRLNEEQRLTQMTTGKNRKERRPKIRGKGRWKERSGGAEPAVGSFRGGVLKLDKRDLKQFKKR